LQSTGGRREERQGQGAGAPLPVDTFTVCGLLQGGALRLDVSPIDVGIFAKQGLELQVTGFAGGARLQQGLWIPIFLPALGERMAQ